MPEKADTGANSAILDLFKADYDSRQPENYSLSEYLELCKTDKGAYASAPERLLKAIGEPEFVETAKDPRLSRIFQNAVIQKFDTFADFYGMEDSIMKVVSFLKHAAQGLEESKQVLYLLGPVGGGKSSLAERLKELMEKEPFYALTYKNPQTGVVETSPVNENPLGLFDAKKYGDSLQKSFGINPRYLKNIMSPWAAKRLREAKGDLSNFGVVKLWPSRQNQIGIAKVEPGDENNQDVSTLVGKVDIRKLEEYAQNDPDAYSYSGGLNRANRGMMEFVEMFKAPIKALNPMLEATQGRNFTGTEAIGAMPWDGIIVAHSNESEWERFRNDKKNEAFIARIVTVRVPYTLRVTEEKQIYEKLIRESTLVDAPVAPQTLEMLAEFSVLTRLKPPANSNLVSKMRVYNGENMKDVDPNSKSIAEHKDTAGVDEGMSGIDTRFAFKRLSEVFNFASGPDAEVAANPVHLMHVLSREIGQMQLPEATAKTYQGFIDEYLKKKYLDFIGKEIKTAYVENYKDYGQNIFDRYVTYADMYQQDQGYHDPDAGTLLSVEQLNAELQKIEKPAGISNPKDFRNEVVKFVLRHQAKNNGENPSWTDYEKMKQVIQGKMFASLEEILPVISFGAKSSEEEEKKHAGFVGGMKKRGYTEKQVRLVSDWYARNARMG